MRMRNLTTQLVQQHLEHGVPLPFYGTELGRPRSVRRCAPEHSSRHTNKLHSAMLEKKCWFQPVVVESREFLKTHLSAGLIDAGDGSDNSPFFHARQLRRTQNHRWVGPRQMATLFPNINRTEEQQTSQISRKGIPWAHSYTTRTSPKFKFSLVYSSA